VYVYVCSHAAVTPFAGASQAAPCIAVLLVAFGVAVANTCVCTYRREHELSDSVEPDEGSTTVTSAHDGSTAEDTILLKT
jgi:hypothetical protein